MLKMISKAELTDLAKALAVWILTIFTDMSVKTVATGLVSFIASVLGVIYLYYRIAKIRVELEDARLDKDLKALDLAEKKKKLSKK